MALTGADGNKSSSYALRKKRDAQMMVAMTTLE